MKKMKKSICLFALFTLFYLNQYANNVLVTATSLTGQNTTGALATHFVNVQFDIAWKNSWRTNTNESNYDGCWIFVKFRKQSTSVWQHATLNITANTVATGGVLQTTADGKGAWIYRSAVGIGDVTYAANLLRWNYGADGVLDNENVEIKVFAVEMVYVPQGPFNLGNASAETWKFRDGAVDTWFPITSENAITCGAGAGNLTAANQFTTTGTIPAAYPKGFNAYWVMKYEFSKQQHLDFLNTLDQTNANLRDNIGAAGNVPNMTVTEPERAAQSFSPVTVLAWLDWAAMRPMTEFEFEKACRGANNLPAPLEYVWGNTTIGLVQTVTGLGTSTETWATGNVMAGLANFSRPAMRCGALATTTSTRTSSGATFYGIMEMGGNAAELTVIANGTGRNYTGLHGDGSLSPTATATVSGWPTNTGTDNNIILRGGDLFNTNDYVQTSNRVGASPANNSTSINVLGGRGVRTGE